MFAPQKSRSWAKSVCEVQVLSFRKSIISLISVKKNWMMRSWKFDVAPKKCGSWHGEACGRRPPIWAQQTLGRIIILFLPAPHPASPNSTSFQTSSSSSSPSSASSLLSCHGSTCSKQSVVEHISGQTNHGATGFQRIIWPRTNKPRMINCGPLL